MTEQARCAPREADIKIDTHHWIGVGIEKRPVLLRWVAEDDDEGFWWFNRGPVSPRSARDWGWTYLHPVSPHDPADIARLVEAAGVVCSEFAQDHPLIRALRTALAAVTAKETT